MTEKQNCWNGEAMTEKPNCSNCGHRLVLHPRCGEVMIEKENCWNCWDKEHWENWYPVGSIPVEEDAVRLSHLMPVR